MKLKKLAVLIAAPLFALGVSSAFAAETVADLHKQIEAAHAEAQKHHADADKHIAEMAKHPHLADHHKAHVARLANRRTQRRAHHATHKSKACATVAACKTELTAAHALRDRAHKHNQEMLAHLKLPAPPKPATPPAAAPKKP